MSFAHCWGACGGRNFPCFSEIMAICTSSAGFLRSLQGIQSGVHSQPSTSPSTPQLAQLTPAHTLQRALCCSTPHAHTPSVPQQPATMQAPTHRQLRQATTGTTTSSNQLAARPPQPSRARRQLACPSPQQRQRHLCRASVQQQQQQPTTPAAQPPAALSDDENDDQQALNPQQQAALAALSSVFTPLEVDRLVSAKPAVLDTPTVADWLKFFDGYGLGKAAMWKQFRYNTQHLTDPYTAGAAIRWLKQLGPWSDADVADRLLPCYPKVLATSTESLQALYDHLTGSLGLSRSDVQSLLWECPGLMADFREEMLPLLTRMIESRRDKYTNGGQYVD